MALPWQTFWVKKTMQFNSTIKLKLKNCNTFKMMSNSYHLLCPVNKTQFPFLPG